MNENLVSSKRQIHTQKKESTRSITYRLPEKLVTELETEASQKSISQNVLVKQILEKYVQWDNMRASGMNSDHRIEGDSHTFLIHHDLGMKWSVFTEQLLTQVFRNFLPDMELKFQTTDTTVILTAPLGSDFNEHDYHD